MGRGSHGSVAALQRSRSSKSQSSTCRCLAGKVGRGRGSGRVVAQGGKPRRSGRGRRGEGAGAQAFGYQEAIREQDQGKVAVQALPAAPLAVVEATRAGGHTRRWRLRSTARW